MDINNDNFKNIATWARQNAKMIAGIFCIIFGFLLIINSKELLGHLVVFVLGLLLINYGFRLVAWKPATDFIDKQLDLFKKKIKQLSRPKN